ncbi:aldose 1-epimerase family protein [Flavobacterium sp.]|uniref:aldose 1-epimerase family protein n=1 Tax=Flavobacterium sp. TaxID=239 RepID=UPI00262EF81F|nr:aldose 1-epimerase family protein [Flavobacterium sp.]
MKISIKNNQLEVVINSQGAELISLQKTSTKREYIWEGNPTFWGKHSPVLFPIVGTLKNNQFEYKNKHYTLPRHGFARDYEFELISKTESSAIFSLQSSTETRAVYPFDFELQLHYVLNENELVVAYKIINKTDVMMPFSIGAHPAFALSEFFEHYSLEFEFQEALKSYSLENDLLSKKTTLLPMHQKQVQLAYSLFENDALIFKEMQSKKITILENGNPLLGFHFNDFKNFGIWTKINAPFLCLEPWLGYSDTINSNGKLEDKEAIQFVAAQQEFLCSFKIEIY